MTGRDGTRRDETDATGVMNAMRRIGLSIKKGMGAGRLRKCAAAIVAAIVAAVSLLQPTVILSAQSMDNVAEDSTAIQLNNTDPPQSPALTGLIDNLFTDMDFDDSLTSDAGDNGSQSDRSGNDGAGYNGNHPDGAGDNDGQPGSTGNDGSQPDSTVLGDYLLSGADGFGNDGAGDNGSQSDNSGSADGSGNAEGPGDAEGRDVSSMATAIPYDDGSDSPFGLSSDPDDFDLDYWMEGFDPDAEFGGLGLEAETGPGVVSISVINTDGDFIDGVIITEDGFRTDNATAGGHPLEITQIPYGERVFGIFLPYSFELKSARVEALKPVTGHADETAELKTETADAENLPPVNITDAEPHWQITFTLIQVMKIRVSYYAVSPNDRFYYVRSGDMAADNPNNATADVKSTAADAEQTAAADKNNAAEQTTAAEINVAAESTAADAEQTTAADKASSTESAVPVYHQYCINTFKNAPVRIAVYIEMPALKDVRGIILSGDGINDVWDIESEYGDFSLPDLTFTDRSCQLISDTSDISPDNVTFTRFFILSLPGAYEGAQLKFNSIELKMANGGAAKFYNPDPSDVTVQIVAAPKLL